MGKPMCLGQVNCFSRTYQVATPAGFALDTDNQLGVRPKGPRAALQHRDPMELDMETFAGEVVFLFPMFFLTRSPPDSVVEPRCRW